MNEEEIRKNVKNTLSALMKQLESTSLSIDRLNYKFGDIPIPLALYVIFSLEKLGVIERTRKHSYSFSNEEYQKIFDKIHYFDYKLPYEWRVSIRDRKGHYNFLVDLLVDSILKNSLIRSSK